MAHWIAFDFFMDEGMELLWPEKWTYLQLMELYEEDPVSFNAELQNAPLNPKECIFDIDGFHYWDSQYASEEKLLAALGEHAEIIGVCDPSTGEDKKRGDYSAILVLVRDSRDGTVYILVADLARRNIDEIIEDILMYHRKYKFQKF